MATPIRDIVLKKAKRLRAEGYAFEHIARETGCSVAGLARNAHRNGWFKRGQQKGSSGNNSVAMVETVEQLAEVVRGELTDDIRATIAALKAFNPNDLSLRDLEKREQIATSVQKRADSLMHLTENNTPIINIAVMSQLPSSINNTVPIVTEDLSHVDCEHSTE